MSLWLLCAAGAGLVLSFYLQSRDMAGQRAVGHVGISGAVLLLELLELAGAGMMATGQVWLRAGGVSVAAVADWLEAGGGMWT